jgi:hypothetical protein
LAFFATLDDPDGKFIPEDSPRYPTIFAMTAQEIFLPPW